MARQHCDDLFVPDSILLLSALWIAESVSAESSTINIAKSFLIVIYFTIICILLYKDSIFTLIKQILVFAQKEWGGVVLHDSCSVEPKLFVLWKTTTLKLLSSQ